VLETLPKSQPTAAATAESATGEETP